MATISSTFDPSNITTPGHYPASRTALLLLDFHSLFVQRVGGPTAASALNVAVALRHWAKSEGIQVIHALIDPQQEPYATCKDVARFAQFLEPMKGDGGKEPAELTGGDSDGDVTFTRKIGHVSALKSPGLLEFLEEKGIKSLVLTGLSTSGCVMRTALTGTDAEFVVTVIADGCADPDAVVHDVILEKVLGNRSYVVTASEFREGFEKVAGK